MAKGILIPVVDFTGIAEDEFHDWYDTEHIPERQNVPGFLSAERWIGAHNTRISVATYELENLDVLRVPLTALSATTERAATIYRPGQNG